MDWNLVRAFLATVEQGSLSAAARHLGLTQPTLSRQIASLESDLGVALFERIGKSLSLTRAGSEILADVRAMGGAVDRLSLIASSQSQSLEGQVRISASDISALQILPPILTRLHARWPDIALDIMASDQISDLMRREADIAIRHVPPDPHNLIAKKCRDQPLRLYASRPYLDRIGRPRTPQDIAKATLVGFSDDTVLSSALAERGLPITEHSFFWTTNNFNAAWEMVKQGLGIGVMLEAIADHTADIELVLPELEPIPMPIWVATHRELHTSRRIRVVYDFLLDELG